jgi:hypothetical protein
MSRTFRKPSHKLYDSSVKKVKDNSRTRVSGSCENNGGCPYCEGNKKYNYMKNIVKIKTLLEEV